VPYRLLFDHFEQVLLRHGGRPHWAKAHPLRPSQLRELYPHLDDFTRVMQRVDPTGILRNPYIERHLFGTTGPDVADRVFKERQ
jgi:L-gulonolactone oxidase